MYFKVMSSLVLAQGLLSDGHLYGGCLVRFVEQNFSTLEGISDIHFPCPENRVLCDVEGSLIHRAAGLDYLSTRRGIHTSSGERDCAHAFRGMLGFVVNLSQTCSP